jgi:hypothetical protein
VGLVLVKAGAELLAVVAGTGCYCFDRRSWAKLKGCCLGSLCVNKSCDKVLAEAVDRGRVNDQQPSSLVVGSSRVSLVRFRKGMDGMDGKAPEAKAINPKKDYYRGPRVIQPQGMSGFDK